MKKHLLGGVKKGAFTEEQAEEKFNAWLEEKEGRIAAKVGNLDKAKADAKAAALKAEKEVSDKRALAAAEAELPEGAEGAEAEEATAAADGAEEAVVAEVEAATEEAAVEEAPVAEEAAAEEAPAAEEPAKAAAEEE